ncbi:MAG: DUF402 domain-containing protein [Thermofilaceae archaeon]
MSTDDHVPRRQGIPRGVRLRGIYSTALARLLIDNGVPIVDASYQLKARFDKEVNEKGVAIVTIKDRYDKRGVIVVGNPVLSARVIDILKQRLVFSLIRVMPVELYATYVCRKLSGTTVELPYGFTGILEGNAEVNSGLFIAHVVGFREGVPILREGIAIVGEYARLFERGLNFVSNYIQGPMRTMLLSLADKAGLTNWGVQWRSSAKWVNVSDLLEELQSLKRKANQVKDIAENLDTPVKLTDGETLAFTAFSTEDKLSLDYLRSKQIPTLKFHHLAKACGEKFSNLIDCLEGCVKCCENSCLSEMVLRNILSEFHTTSLKIFHEKPDGSIVKIKGRTSIFSREPLVLRIDREMRSGGVYNGIRIKKEEGDYATSIVVPFSYLLPHLYFNQKGELKGIYININSPIEPCPPDAIWYIDALVDVVWSGEKGAEIINEKNLREATSKGLFSEKASNHYIDVANEVSREIREKQSLEKLVELSLRYSCCADVNLY